jgi:hypothetical protein
MFPDIEYSQSFAINCIQISRTLSAVLKCEKTLLAFPFPT